MSGYQVSTAVALHSHEYLPFVLERIHQAKKRIWASIFIVDARLYTDPTRHVRTLLDSLAAARERGIEIRLLIGSSANSASIFVANATSAMVMQDLGIPVKHFNSRQSTHSKYLLIDDDWVVLGGHNWTCGSLHRHIDSSVAVRSPAMRQALASEFGDHWKTGLAACTLKGRCPQSLFDWTRDDSRLRVPAELKAEWETRFAPRARQTWARRTEDVAAAYLLRDQEYRNHALPLLRAARESLDIAMFYMVAASAASPAQKMVEAVIAARRRGVKVRVVLDEDGKNDIYNSRTINKAVLKRLQAAKVPVRVDSQQQLLHSKLVLIDARHVLVGSHNWTTGSLQRYDDTSVHIESEKLRAEYGRMFDALWDFAEHGPAIA